MKITGFAIAIALLASGCYTTRFSPREADIFAPSVAAEAVLSETDGDRTQLRYGASGDSKDLSNDKNVVASIVLGEPTGVSVLWPFSQESGGIAVDTTVGAGWINGPSLHVSSDLVLVSHYGMMVIDCITYFGPGVRFRLRNAVGNEDQIELGPRFLLGAGVGNGDFYLTLDVAPGFDFRHKEPTIDTTLSYRWAF
jgi:hypothetical protein